MEKEHGSEMITLSAVLHWTVDELVRFVEHVVLCLKLVILCLGFQHPGSLVTHYL